MSWIDVVAEMLFQIFEQRLQNLPLFVAAAQP
jgi:hypothetical protein